jgi:hypothetical protein
MYKKLVIATHPMTCVVISERVGKKGERDGGGGKERRRREEGVVCVCGGGGEVCPEWEEGRRIDESQNRQ